MHFSLGIKRAIRNCIQIHIPFSLHQKALFDHSLQVHLSVATSEALTLLSKAANLIAKMDDELVSIVLPIFRDASIDDEDRTEQAWELLKENSPRKGQALEDQRSRVFLMCREIVEGEIAAAAEERRRQALATGPSSRDPTSDPRNVPGQPHR